MATSRWNEVIKRENGINLSIGSVFACRLVMIVSASRSNIIERLAAALFRLFDQQRVG